MSDDVIPDAPLSRGRFVTLRLAPGAEVMGTLRRYVAARGWEAVAVVSVVGSLTDAAIRFANREETTRLSGHFEVVALSGTLECAPGRVPDPDLPGGGHLHIGLSDGEGRMIGGHMMPGCLVYTTLELVLLVLEDVTYLRRPCALSGYDELDPGPRTRPPATTGSSS